MLGLKLIYVSKMAPSKNELLINTEVGFSFQVSNYYAWLGMYFVLFDNTTDRNIHSIQHRVCIDFYNMQNIHI